MAEVVVASRTNIGLLFNEILLVVFDPWRTKLELKFRRCPVDERFIDRFDMSRKPGAGRKCGYQFTWWGLRYKGLRYL